MFSGFTDETIRFFLDLKFHNNTSFFHENHDRYVENVQNRFYELIEELAPDMLSIDPDFEVRPYKCLSRIHRDTRFYKDKSPYRDFLWFLFRRSGEPREKSLTYYFEMGPDRLDWGLGFWDENREAMDLFRKRMTAYAEETAGIINSLRLEERGMRLGGTVFRRMAVPENIPDSLKAWYPLRNLYVGKDKPDYQLVFSGRIAEEVRNDFLALAPLYGMLRGNIDEILMKG